MRNLSLAAPPPHPQESSNNIQLVFHESSKRNVGRSDESSASKIYPSPEIALGYSGRKKCSLTGNGSIAVGHGGLWLSRVAPSVVLGGGGVNGF